MRVSRKVLAPILLLNLALFAFGSTGYTCKLNSQGNIAPCFKSDCGIFSELQKFVQAMNSASSKVGSVEVIAQSQTSNRNSSANPSSQNDKTTPASVGLSEAQYEFYKQLVALDLSSILDEGDGEALCKKIGQAAFETFKTPQISSYDAMRKVVEIVEAIRDHHKEDGRERYRLIEWNFDGIGDQEWSWMR